jgi:very-short-patch-repair endonuclease
LTENNIYFEHQKTFDGLYYKSKKGRLKFDFFIPDANLLIEYDGEYHYKPISFSRSITGEEQLALTRIRDKLKDDYAKNNGISLVRIRYDEDIVTKLKTALLP